VAALLWLCGRRLLPQAGNWRGERMWVNPPPRLLLEFVHFPQRSLALAPALICAPCERGLPLLKWHSRSGQAHDIYEYTHKHKYT